WSSDVCSSDLSLFTFEMADQVYNLSRLQTRGGDVLEIKKHDAPPVADPAISIVRGVDRRIKLVVTANCHHQKLIRLKIVLRQFVHGKLRLPALRVKDAVARCIRQMEAARFADARGVVIETRNGPLDTVANFIVVVRQIFPVDGCAMLECGSRESRHDLWFAQ